MRRYAFISWNFTSDFAEECQHVEFPRTLVFTLPHHPEDTPYTRWQEWWETTLRTFLGLRADSKVRVVVQLSTEGGELLLSLVTPFSVCIDADEAYIQSESTFGSPIRPRPLQYTPRKREPRDMPIRMLELGAVGAAL
ncbi:hypothetical protein VTO73DRAFT_4438 [Trametes versicolor]